MEYEEYLQKRNSLERDIQVAKRILTEELWNSKDGEENLHRSLDKFIAELAALENQYPDYAKKNAQVQAQIERFEKDIKVFKQNAINGKGTPSYARNMALAQDYEQRLAKLLAEHKPVRKQSVKEDDLQQIVENIQQSSAKNSPMSSKKNTPVPSRKASIEKAIEQKIEEIEGGNDQVQAEILAEEEGRPQEAKEQARKKSAAEDAAEDKIKDLGVRFRDKVSDELRDALRKAANKKAEERKDAKAKDTIHDFANRTNKANNTNKIQGLKDAARLLKEKERKLSKDARNKRIQSITETDGELRKELKGNIHASANTMEEYARLEELVRKKNLSTLYAKILQANLKKPLPKRNFAEPNELQKKAEKEIESRLGNKKTRNKDYKNDSKGLKELFSSKSFNLLKQKAHDKNALSEYMKDYDNKKVDDQVIKELKERNALTLAPLKSQFVNRAIKNNSMTQPSYFYAMNDLDSIKNKMDDDSINKYEVKKFIEHQKLAKDQMENDRALVDRMASRKEGNINYLRSAKKENYALDLRDISDAGAIGLLRQQREQQKLDEARSKALLEMGREKHAAEDMNRFEAGKTTGISGPDKLMHNRTEVVKEENRAANIVGATAQAVGNGMNEYAARNNRFKATGGHIYQDAYPAGTPVQYKKRTLQDIIAETQQQPQQNQEQEPEKEKNKWWDSDMWNAMSAMIAGQNKGGIGGISQGYQEYTKQQDANDIASGALAQKILASRAIQAQKAMEWEQKKRDFDDKSEDRQLRRAETAKYHDISLAQQAAKIALAKEKQQGDIEKSSNQMSEADKNLHKHLLGVMKASEKSFFPSSAAAKAKKTLSLYNSGVPLSQAYETVHNTIKSTASAGNPKTINKSLEAKIAAAQRS